MLSVLIPNYNHDCLELVEDLHRQLMACGSPFELIVAEDGSTLHVAENNRMSRLQGVRHVICRENRGRYRMRYWMPGLAQYPYLLCLDSDAKVVRGDFVEKYLEYARRGTEAVLVGGLAARPGDLSDPEHSLRLAYERQRESRTDIKKGLSCFNYMIRADVMRRLQPDADFPAGYGHEDTVMGLELKRMGVEIRFIDNPLLHSGLDTNEKMLEKSVMAGRNLLALYRGGRYPGLEEESRLLKTYLKLKRWRLAGLFRSGYGLCRNPVRANLLSPDPKMLCFDLFRLGEMAWEDAGKKPARLKKNGREVEKKVEL